MCASAAGVLSVAAGASAAAAASAAMMAASSTLMPEAVAVRRTEDIVCSLGVLTGALRSATLCRAQPSYNQFY